MDEHPRIGIQFNLDEKADIKPWLAAHSPESLESDAEHFEVRFNPKELTKLTFGDTSKLEIIKLALREFLAASEYTVIYTYVEAGALAPYKQALLEGPFREQRIEVKELTTFKSFLGNFQGKLTSGPVRRILKKGQLMAAIDDLLPFVANRDFATEQSLTLEIEYETFEEWEGIEDALRAAIILKIPDV